MRVAANRDVCIGGLCMLNTSAVFDRHDDEIVAVLTEDVSPTNEADHPWFRYARPSHKVRIRVQAQSRTGGHVWWRADAFSSPAFRLLVAVEASAGCTRPATAAAASRRPAPRADRQENDEHESRPSRCASSGQLAVVRDDPALVQPAVEELLRWLTLVTRAYHAS